jgi:putative lipoprotein
MTMTFSRQIYFPFTSAAAAVIVAATLSACDPAQTPDQRPAARAAAELKTFAFVCEANGYIVADYRRSERVVWLFLHGETLQLNPVAASGTRHSNGEITFWTKGSEAMLERDDTVDRCTENRRASIIEDARLRGVDFRATGNEPGWELEIGPAGILLIANYGTDRHRFPATQPAEDRKNRVTTYRSESGVRSLGLRLTQTRCRDSMSDDVYETTVEVTFDGQIWRGCGQALH